MEFDLPKEQSSIIKVFGVGGGGSNAVNHMYQQGIKGVDFVVCNTDNQALDISPVPTKIQLGKSLTEGRGAGSLAEVGRNAAIEDIEQIREILANNTKMVCVTAGMGGGTGTGAAPVIAQVAKEMGILTVGIVTMPFMFEGRKRKQQASEGIEEFRKQVDTLLIINNDKLRDIFGNLSLKDAFGHADNVLTTAAKGIAEIITVTGSINVDFEDVRTVMTDSGVAIMGSATATGENRSLKAVEEALSSPLLNDNNITGARYVLLNITYGQQEVLMDEIMDITDYIQDASGNTADVIWGHGLDESLGDEVCVTIIATGFNSAPDTGVVQEVKKNVVSLDAELPTNLTSPIHQLQPIPEPIPQAVAPQVVSAPVVEEPYLKTEAPVATVEETPVVKEKPQATIPFEIPAPVHVEKEEQVQATVELPIEQVNEVVAETIIEKSVVETPPVTFEAPVAETKEENPIVNEVIVEEVVAEPETEKESDFAEPYMMTPAPVPVVEQEVSDAREPALKTTAEEPQGAVEPTVNAVPKSINEISVEDQQARSSSRLNKLKELSMRLRTPSGISDLENEPAYKRRNVNLEETPHSSESQVSRFTLGEDEEGKSSLRDNNSFLHDNVD
jgi:cell division protein FtsZ